MNGPCVSIVVPVYNVGKYLGRCVDSLLKTCGIEKTEIILVDDGSTDDSGRICDSYAERYEFIECFHKENGGLSDARNYGLGKASGRYVFFLDSDDEVDPDGLGSVIDILDKADCDMLLWDGKVIDEAGDDIPSTDANLIHNGLPVDGTELSGTDVMVRLIKDHNKIANTAWLRACRRDFLIENDLLFEKGLIHEDALWTPKALINAQKVIYVPEKVYCYRTRNKSIARPGPSEEEARAKALVYIMNSLYGYYTEYVSDKAARRILLSNWAEIYMWEMAQYGFDRYECSKDIPRGKIFSSCRTFKTWMKGFVLLILGTGNFCRMYRSHIEGKG